jgi:hypothetical protein
MTHAQLLRTIAAGIGAAALLAQSAAAGGEPKNEWPFTRPVGTRTTQAAHGSPQRAPLIQGEPKNEPPFTRPATVVVTTARGFSWTDGTVGALAGIGIALAGGGGALIVRRSPRTA